MRVMVMVMGVIPDVGRVIQPGFGISRNAVPANYG